MLKKNIFNILAITLLPASLQAQSSLTTDIGFGFAGGSGDYTAHYITANQHGALSAQSNSANLRAGVFGQTKQNDWSFDYGLDLLARKDDYTPYYLQQLYARAQWRQFYLEAGAREYPAALRNQRLSSGSLLWSGNSHPIPQLRLGTEGFWKVPGTHGNLEAMFDMDYGLFMDDDFLEKRYDEYNPGGNTLSGYAQSFITTGAWHHQKRLFLRSNSSKPVVFTFGLEHAVQFGGTTTNYVNNTIMGTLEQKVGFKDIIKVFIPSSGDSDAAVGDQNFIYGNHLGVMSLMLDWNIDQQHSLSAYVENLFEDGSAFCKRNGWDGLWGLEYRSSQQSWIDGIVLEYLQTTDQSGAIHWAPQDHKGELSGQARGADEYYNNYFYCGYAHFGQSMGSPMLKSPIYNSDSYLRFTDNRVQAWHMGIEGTLLTSRQWSRFQQASLAYRALLSYRNAYGTMAIPSAHIRHDLSLLAELNCQLDAWNVSMAYGQDHGSLMGNNNTFNFSVKYHGKIF